MRLFDVERGDEPGAAEHQVVVAVGGDPLVGGVGERPPHPAPVAVLLEPLPQARPLAEQRLVGDLGVVVAGDDETVIDQRAEHRAWSSSTTSSVEGARRRTSSVPSPGSARRRKRSRRDGALAVVEPAVHVLGELRDRALDAARRRVALDA